MKRKFLYAVVIGILSANLVISALNLYKFNNISKVPSEATKYEAFISVSDKMLSKIKIKFGDKSGSIYLDKKEGKQYLQFDNKKVLLNNNYCTLTPLVLRQDYGMYVSESSYNLAREFIKTKYKLTDEQYARCRFTGDIKGDSKKLVITSKSDFGGKNIEIKIEFDNRDNIMKVS